MTPFKDISAEPGLSLATRSRALNGVLQLKAPTPNLFAIAFDRSLTVTRAPLCDTGKPLADALIDRSDDVHASDLQTLVRADLVLCNSAAHVPWERVSSWPLT